MTKEADVFCLTDEHGNILPPAVQATVLAKYSRSPEGAREILSKLTEDESNKFQGKWVVSYGHNSVAELASIAVCLEGISIVASKYIESWQRPGYSEKSTRYQVFSGDSFVTPPGAPATMKNFAARFYETYDRLMGPMLEICAKKMGKEKTDRLVKARAFDNLRYLLPAGTGTNVAMNAYVRDIRDMIVHLRGHSNPELKSLGDKLHDAVYEVVPTLVKHTEADTFDLPILSVGPTNPQFHETYKNWYVGMLGDKNDFLLEQKRFEKTVSHFHHMGWSSFQKHMESRTPFQEVPKVFKTVPISFEIMMDYGAYRDLQRHRRCEQFAEPLTTNYGYLVPDDIQGTEIEAEYREVMESIELYQDENVIYDRDLMQYMIPLGYLHRSIFQMDLRELYYIVELRTKPQGHISYRRIAYAMYELAKEHYPELMAWCIAHEPSSIGEHHLSMALVPVHPNFQKTIQDVCFRLASWMHDN